MHRPGEEPKRLVIDSLAYGPHGVGRLDGKAIFVRGVVPGDVIDVIVREDHERYAYADLIEIVHGAAGRRDPPCPFVPRCGGCPWQHIDDARQREAKERNLREALARIGRWPDAPVAPIVAPGDPFGYRSRLSLRTAGRRVGFYAAASHDLVEIDHCRIAAPAVDAAIAAAADLVRHSPDAIRRVEILACERTTAIVLVGEVEGEPHPRGEEFATEWLAQRRDVIGLALNGKRWRRTWGQTAIVVCPESDFELRASAGAFTQVHPEANRYLVQRVLELGAFQATDRVLDLYAGIGNLSLPIARRAGAVLAVEQNPVAAADARENVRALGIANCTIETMTTRRALNAAVGRGQRFDVVVLDPPRSGAAEALDAILTLAPARLVYVSCNPSTLARDLSRLRQAYAFDRLEPIDMFPQGYHVEVVARGVRRLA